jgi:hypothetical protein
MQLLKSLVAGIGAYLFFRRVLGVGFWPAAVGAWCYPITGYFILWQGYFGSSTVAWFPWLLLATDRVVRRPASLWAPALAGLTAVQLTVGALDIAGQALLVVGLYALWRLALRYVRPRAWGRLAGAAASLVLAWGLGFLLVSFALLPLADYLPTGARMQRRARGGEERPPIGLKVLPQTVLPYTYGSSRDGAVYLLEEHNDNLLESAAGAYAGLLAALVLAPLGWCSRRHRAVSLFWLLLGLLGLAWVVKVPVLVGLMRLPVLNLLSFNRFTFVTGFAVLTGAVIGLDVLRRGLPPRRGWFAIPAALLVVLGVWCLSRAAAPPEPYDGKLESQARGGPRSEERLAEARAAQNGFENYHRAGAAWCAIGLAAWTALWLGGRPGWAGLSRRWLVPAAGGVLATELLVFAYDFNPQCDPGLYYPPVRALEQLAARPPGRFLGLNCLPPRLNEMCGLSDVRGYDAVDPLRLVELLDTVRDRSSRVPVAEYAVTQHYIPLLPLRPSGKVWLPPVLSMLNVRYIVGRGRPPRPMRPIIQQDDYWVWENEEVLPRAFVPASVRPAPPRTQLLRLLGAPSFDPRRIAYLDNPPALLDACRGSASIVAETPGHITLRLDMQTPGLVVLADQWYEGWQATLNGEPVPVLRVNHALRGVVAPAGQGTLEFVYRPAGFVTGLRLALGGLGALLVWVVVCCVRQRRKAGTLAPSAAVTRG